MSTERPTRFRVGTHWGTTIIREGGESINASEYRRDDDELVAVVVNGDVALAERICQLLNGVVGTQVQAAQEPECWHGDCCAGGGLDCRPKAWP